LQKALAQPEQEPVVWWNGSNYDSNAFIYNKDKRLFSNEDYPIPLYTEPLSKKWDGLTEDDFHTIRGDAFNKNVDDMNWAVMMARKINFILRGRNT
jgi:hypothetical protein